MALKLLLIVLVIKIVAAKINLDVNIENKEATVTFDGTETHTLTVDEVHKLVGKDDLREGTLTFINVQELLLGYYNKREHCTGPSKKVVSIKSATVKRLNTEPVIVVSQDFENPSNHTIKMHTGISHTVQNTLTTNWSKEPEYNITKDVEYGFNVGYAGFGANFQRKSGFSFSLKGGVSEEKTKTETIGTTSGMEVELKPGEAVTVILSANAGTLEIEVEHEASLKGPVSIDCHCGKKERLNQYIDTLCEDLQTIMHYGDINNSFTTTETIKFNYFVDSNIRVYEKNTGVQIL